MPPNLGSRYIVCGFAWNAALQLPSNQGRGAAEAEGAGAETADAAAGCACSSPEPFLSHATRPQAMSSEASEGRGGTQRPLLARAEGRAKGKPRVSTLVMVFAPDPRARQSE